MTIKSVAGAGAAALMVLLGLPLLRALRTRSRGGEHPRLADRRKRSIASRTEGSREADTAMAGKRYEYAAIKVAPDQTPVPDLNKLGTDGYHIVAAVGQLLLLERKVKGDTKEEEEED